MNRTTVLLLVESISTWQYYLPLLVLIEEKGSMTIVNEWGFDIKCHFIGQGIID